MSSNIMIAQFVLALGGMFLGTAEFAAMGLLPDMARTFEVDIPSAGHFVSAYAIGVVIGAPLLSVLTARMEKRRLLMFLASLVIIGNGTSAMANSYALEMIARFISGLPHGAYYGTAGVVSASLVPASQRTRAISRVMLGLAAANVIGVPAATWMGQALGWRSAFGAVALGGTALLVLLPLTVPKRPVDRAASPLCELSAFRSPQVWFTLATAAIGFGGMFAVYSYITPTLVNVTGQPDSMVPWYLALWGAGMVVGNVVGGWLADRSLTGTIIGFMIWDVVFLTAFYWTAETPLLAAGTLFFIGVGFALVPALQARLMDAAPKAQSLASATNHSAFNFSNALGAWTGGITIALGYGWESTGLVAGALALLGLVIFVVSLSFEKNVVNEEVTA
ncbi:MFS transporter [Agrobacterium sp. CNPSo 2736]|uniref:MFS transporter n=1 Tax=Agrobacterium sp. CNPSo 2736 TaxID=2499627 RepID=UPI00196A92EE|nr:MFS transporter [Agrobacterium sp. CNPSo 2736]